MKILIAMMSHETNTFSPVPTELERFGNGEAPKEDAAAYHSVLGKGIAMAGMIQAVEGYAELFEKDIQIVTSIAAGSPPSGPVSDAAFDYIVNNICDAAVHCDAVLLDLHGAMVTNSFDDGEGVLLKKLRANNPSIPIGVGLDMHANLTSTMVDNATLIAGYQTYPHIDIFETGERVGLALMKVLFENLTVTMAWGNCPMLPHVMRQGTDDEPNKSLQEAVRQLEQNETVLTSLFTGFPHADIKDAGLSVVIVTNNNLKQAETIKENLLEQAWINKESFVYQKEELHLSITRAIEASKTDKSGPIILLDHYDNTASGGTMDTTEVLREILDRGLEDVAAFGIYDPEAVKTMVKKGVGAHIEVTLGGKMHMDALEVQSKPLVVSGLISKIFDGHFTVTGPMGTGSNMNMGETVILDTGAVQIIVISRHIEPYDLGCFTSLGIDPTKKRYLMLKSRIHYRAAFMPIAKEIIECAGVGVCTSDFDQLTFKQVRRPIYPLDPMSTRK
ncbi:MAG: microcystin degradation protein MlrC [Candidatus Azotimanducaceae bacterium]|jgi:microcystin degradation protein MlrC